MIAYLIAAAALLFIGFGTGWQTHGWKTGAEQKAALEAAIAAKEAETKRANDISDRFEKKLASIRIVNRTINNEVRHETEKTVYTDCVVPDSGRGLLNTAIGAANGDAAKPGAEVRAPAKGGGGSAPNDGRSPGVVDSGGSIVRRLFGPSGSASGSSDAPK